MDMIESRALYDERDDVSWARPLLQGDVFDQIILPGFGEEPMKVQIISHPCAMRKGPDMLQRITVAPVVPHQPVLKQSGWNGNLRVMPLPDLSNEQHYATRFVDVTAAPVELLSRACRIATLTRIGIYVLQQRLIKHYTRVELPLELLRRESSTVLAEAELQWDWVEAALSQSELADESAIEAETKVFDAWLNEGEPPRRHLLKHEIHHADIRKQLQRSVRERNS